MAYTGKQPTLNRTKYTPLSSDPLNPAEGDVFRSDGTSRTKGLWEYKDSAWTPISDSSGGLDVFHIDDFEVNTASSFSTGNNATFLGAGSLLGTLADEEVTPISKRRSLSYTQAAGSLNDYVASPIINLDPKQAGNDSGVNLYFTYTGDSNDIKVVVYDNTNGALISSSLDLLSSASNPTRFSTSIYIPSAVTEIRWGVQVVVENIGAVLVLDDVEFSLNPFVYGNLEEKETVTYTGYSSKNGSAEVLFNTLKEDDSSRFLLVSNTDHTRYTFKQAVNFTSTASIFGSGNDSTECGLVLYNSSDVAIRTSKTSHNATGGTSIPMSGKADEGDYLVVFTNGTPLNDTNNNFSVTASATSEHVITPAKSNRNTHSAYITNNGVTAELIAWSSDWLSAPVRVEGGRVDLDYSRLGLTEAPAGITVTPRGVTGNAFASASNVTNTSCSVYMDGDGASGLDTDFSITIELHENDVQNATFLAAIPVQKVAIIEDQKASGVNGGAFTSGAWQTRDLNTVSGNTDIVSLSANVFTLKPGSYYVKWSAPAKEVNLNKSRLYNITGSDVVAYGQNNQTTHTVANATGYSAGEASFSIAEESDFRIEHRCSITNSTDGFGIASSFGDVEVYSRMTITKLR